jgi:hypothetical protein
MHGAEIRTNRARDRMHNRVKSLKLTPDGKLPRVRAKAKKKYNIHVAGGRAPRSHNERKRGVIDGRGQAGRERVHPFTCVPAARVGERLAKS